MVEGSESKGKTNWGKGSAWALLALFFAFPLVTLIVGRSSNLASKLGRDERPARAEAPSRSRSANEEDEMKHLLGQSRDHLAREDAVSALVPLARAVSLAPENAEIHNNLCVAYGILKRRRAAVGECGEALRLKPSFRLAQNNLRWVSSLPIDTDAPERGAKSSK